MRIMRRMLRHTGMRRQRCQAQGRNQQQWQERSQERLHGLSGNASAEQRDGLLSRKDQGLLQAKKALRPDPTVQRTSDGGPTLHWS
jgi:hypothetical protein